jgi:glutamyl/glutaminyl-tRNA synthetase
LCQPYLVDRLENQKSKIKNQNDNSKLKIKEVIGIEQKRLEYLAQITDHAKFFFELPEYDKNLLKWKKMSDKDIKKSLEISQKIISEIPEKNFIAENLRKLLLTQAEKMGDRGELLWPLRVALSGQKNSPPPFEIAEILGKEESLERIEKAIRLLA